MKALYIFISTMFVFFCIYSNSIVAQEKTKNVTLRIIRITWPNKLWHTVTSDTTLITVEEGIRFGAHNTLPYFTLLKILDSSNIAVQYSHELFIIGESIHLSSDVNITNINLEGKCFRMIQEDSGSDFCIDILTQ
ncbi:MAG: hypothetical protein ACOCW8_03415 [bacterium]